MTLTKSCYGTTPNIRFIQRFCFAFGKYMTRIRSFPQYKALSVVKNSNRWWTHSCKWFPASCPCHISFGHWWQNQGSKDFHHSNSFHLPCLLCSKFPIVDWSQTLTAPFPLLTDQPFLSHPLVQPQSNFSLLSLPLGPKGWTPWPSRTCIYTEADIAPWFWSHSRKKRSSVRRLSVWRLFRLFYV